jgi:hypothetical protein
MQRQRHPGIIAARSCSRSRGPRKQPSALGRRRPRPLLQKVAKGEAGWDSRQHGQWC